MKEDSIGDLANKNPSKKEKKKQVSYSRVRNVKNVDKLVKEIDEEASKTTSGKNEIKDEVQNQKELITSITQKSGRSEQELQEMEARLREISNKNRKHSKCDDTEDEEYRVLTRNPMGNKDCCKYDSCLLQNIKAQHTETDDVENPLPQRQVIPYELPSDQLEGKSQLVVDCLQKIGDWDFDVFQVQIAMSGSFDHIGLLNQHNGGSLFVTAYCTMVRFGLIRKFNINEKTLLSWLSLVEAGYHPNPYHNSMHAADVLHVTSYILKNGGLIECANLSDEDIFAAVFAAVIHDFNHPGINNNFHIRVQTYLAILFNDRSVLENVHVSCTFELMKIDKFNVLECFSDDQRRNLKETVTEMVLSTDMGLHAKILSTFKRRLSEDHNFTKKEDIRLALSMALKVADISNCGRPENLYRKWCDQISDEFYLQGDRERNCGFPVSPFMDRYSANVPKGQTAFMNYIVVPLFECISEYLPEMHFTVDFTENNKAYWATHKSG